MKALKEIGFKKAFRYVILSPINIFMQLLPYPQLRSLLLKILGAKIGKHTVIENATFVNFYYNGFGNLQMGKNCFIGPKAVIDLAEKIVMEDNSTISMGSIVLTHMNVGYKDHPLQSKYPKKVAAVTLKQGSFVGAGSIIFPGVELGEKCLVGAGSVVKQNQPGNTVVAGNPAVAKKKI